MRQRNDVNLTEREEKLVSMTSKMIAWIIVIPILIIVEVFLGTYLWSCIAVAVFGLPALTKCQFFGLTILTSILFGRVNVNSGGK